MFVSITLTNYLATCIGVIIMHIQVGKTHEKNYRGEKIHGRTEGGKSADCRKKKAEFVNHSVKNSFSWWTMVGDQNIIICGYKQYYIVN